jgi:hypothetical protein
MKLTLSLFFLFIFSASAYAQTENNLPVDDRGKLIYYEVVELKNVAKDSLKLRSISYFKRNDKALKFKKIDGDTSFFATGKMIISKTVLVMSHPSGEILYNFQVEVKDGKYRFWLTDFNFIPYERDRYGNFVPSTSTGIPLENETGKLNAAQLAAYRMQTAMLAKEFAVRFKAHMASKPPVVAQTQEKKIVNKDW